MRCRGCRPLLAALAVLLVGIPLSAAPPETKASNFLDHVIVARVNIEAAEASLPLEADAKVRKSLDASVEALRRVETDWSKLYKQKPATLKEEQIKPGVSPTEDLDKAASELASASTVAVDPKINSKIKDGLKKAREQLKAGKDLATIVKGPDTKAETDLQNEADLAKAPKDKGNPAATPPQQNPDPGPQVAPPDEGPSPQPINSKWQLAVSIGAAVLALVAIVLVFLPVGPVAKLRSGRDDLQENLKRLSSKYSGLSDDLSKLQDDYDSLKRSFTKSEEQAKVQRAVALELEQRAARPGAGRRASDPPPPDATLSAIKATDLATVAGQPAPSKLVPKQPLSAYNETRTLKAADRSEEFQRLYPQQMTMACVNPAARTSGAPTDLRFKEDPYGNFLAVVDGKETLIFPDLTYDYGTGRKTFEGVFEYPGDESSSFQLVLPAAIQRRGEEWALVRQGVFKNG